MFAAACIHCLWETEVQNRQPLEQIFFRLGQDQTISKSMGHRLETLLDLMELQEDMSDLAHNILLGYEHGEGWPSGT